MHENHIVRKGYLESPQKYMMELLCERANDFKLSAVFTQKSFIKDF